MAEEIERKFLVHFDKLPALPPPLHIRQGYIPTLETTVRIRISENNAFLTLKGRARGITRSEFEYAVPLADAEAMLREFCRHTHIEKRRYRIPYEGHMWELDIFEGENSGLMIAEIELASETESFLKPDWVGEEVSGDARYRNANLVAFPYRRW